MDVVCFCFLLFGGNSQLGVLMLFWIGGQETGSGALAPGITVTVSILEIHLNMW